MASPAIWLSTLFIIGCLTLTHGQDNAQTRIPQSLIHCYDNQTLRNPEYRPPMSIETFIDIVRKIESYQRNSMDITTLVVSMIHRFRLDGIQRSDVAETDGVLPYAVNGFDFYKHRLVLRYLVPGNNYQFPNESLSSTEQCTLHFMLSHSIDKMERGDESVTCSKLSNYESGRSRIRRSNRYRRQVDNSVRTSTVQTIKLDSSESGHGDSTEEKIDKQNENINLTSSENSEENLKQTTEDPLSQEGVTDEDKADVEVIHDSDKNDTSGKFIFDDNIHIPQEPKSRKVILAPTTGTNQIDTHRPVPRNTITTKESDCPVENGVVKTKWGSVALGTVITGIAAGLLPQSLKVQNLVVGGPRTKTMEKDLSTADIDNKFAVTLTGDLAEVALNQGPRKLDDLSVGTVGGWNNTFYPRWYFDKQNEDNEMTDAEIRGGLDGLILATYAEKWKNSVPGGLKLSDLLAMYYSEDGVLGDTSYSACKRRDLYSGVAPNTVMQEQAYRFAAVLDQQSLTSASVEYSKIQEFANTAVSKLGNYLPAMTENSCSGASKQPRTANSTGSTTAYTNITVVIDRNWAYSDIKNILYYLMKELVLSDIGSRMTVVDGKNRAPFFTDAVSTLALESNFTESAYNRHDAGMDIPTAMELQLEQSMEGLLDLEKQNNIAGARSTVILFIPKDVIALNNNDLTIVKSRLEHFREYLPDVKFLYLAPGNKENYNYVVENPTTDVFTIQSSQTNINDISSMLDPVIARIQTIPLRLRNPTCGSDWKGESYSSAEFIYYTKPQGANYYKLHPNYFFGQGSFQVVVTPLSSSNLKVCYSRKSVVPDNATGDATCQQSSSGAVTIKIDNPCGDLEYISQCSPLYISVTSTGTNTKNDCTGCTYPHYIKYSVKNEGLGCRAGVGRFLSNSHLITFTAFIVLFWRNIKFSI